LLPAGATLGVSFSITPLLDGPFFTAGDADGTTPLGADVPPTVPVVEAPPEDVVVIVSATSVQFAYSAPVTLTRSPRSVGSCASPVVDVVKYTFTGLSHPVSALSALSVIEPAIAVTPFGAGDGLSPVLTACTVPVRVNVKDEALLLGVALLFEHATAARKRRQAAIAIRMV
jgi:hypothetical protein